MIGGVRYPYRPRGAKLTLIALYLNLLLGSISQGYAKDYFNPALLSLDKQALSDTDLTVFEQDGPQAPGKYRVDLFLNSEQIDSLDIDFEVQKNAEGQDALLPCLSVDLLKILGVKSRALSSYVGDEQCVNLSQTLPMASAYFDFSQQRLNLTIPQAALDLRARGYVAPDKLDQGINALLLNYSFSGASNQSKDNNGQNSNDYYLNLRSGANLGAWRLRNYSTWSRNGAGEDRWDSINTYVQRDIIALNSKLVMGDSTSPSDIFDSVPFRGAMMASDDGMLPDSMQGYSPIVKGIANTNAQVIITQNGYQIYQDYVPPGAFEITDLYPTAGSGDLNVTIKEADGTEQNFLVPYAAVPVLQREGRFKYSLVGGEYRPSGSDIDKKPFVQAAMAYGLPWAMTGYGGVQASGNVYQSVMFGLGKNMSYIGAVSVDVEQAKATVDNLPDREQEGQSWRVRYSKNFIETGTNLAIASYRYSTEGFYSLTDTLNSYTNGRYIGDSRNDHRKSRQEMSVSQDIGESLGSFSISYIDEDYWNENSNQSASLGYSNNWSGISYGLNYSYNKNSVDSDGDRTHLTDHIFSLNISVPLDAWLSNSYANYSLNTSRNGKTSNNVGVSGSLLKNNNLTYNVNQGYTSQGEGNSGNAGLDYRGGYGRANVGYSYDSNINRVNYGLEGGMMLHANGLTLSQSMGETVALVKAPGADNIGVTNGVGVRTDWRGYAVVPYVTAYRKNVVSLDTTSFSDDVDMTLTSQMVTPTRGAVVRAEYNPSVGLRGLLTLRQSNGEFVPFGAIVSANKTSDNANIVGEEGQVYLSGMDTSGKLNVKWGDDSSQQCAVNYSIPDTPSETGIHILNASCQ
ncbi:fimbria/pilus outer membrane usher protein [Budvicia diplopodorum]|uniref:fimbria/pilus outer membrane usher protein n=1 Tax=Budvicia diplopodorum TaxID=1119056 RepID=UPI001359B50C|nr:fimbria/pilus outer membrane usher protein [Budvicia diplopodorum]